jgi:hypothetical protein
MTDLSSLFAFSPEQVYKQPVTILPMQYRNTTQTNCTNRTNITNCTNHTNRTNCTNCTNLSGADLPASLDNRGVRKDRLVMDIRALAVGFRSSRR